MRSSGYDEMSKEYNQIETRVIWQRPEMVMQALGDLSGKRVADIGAGTGYFAFRVAAAGAEVIAIDVDPRAVEFMNSEELRYPEEIQDRFSTRIATADSPQLREGEVDIVMMVNTYGYLQERVEYFKNLQSGMKNGGRVLIIDFKKKETTIGPEVEDRISLQQVQHELAEAGFTIVDVDEESLQYQYIVQAIRP